MDLTPEEARLLRELADSLVSGTRDRTYWLTGVRHTCLTLLHQIALWLGESCGECHPLTGTGCVRPDGHVGFHTDVFGHLWPQDQNGTTRTEPEPES